MSYFTKHLQGTGIECPKIIVETGTYLGEGIETYLKSAQFTKIYSIEISTKYYLMNKQKFEAESSVCLLEGNSADVIKTLHDQEPILFYLDAHFSGGDTGGETISNGCPLLDELTSISERGQKGDVIFIDDMRLMGRASWGGTEGDIKYPKTFYDFTHASQTNIIKALGSRRIHTVRMLTDIDRLMIILD